MSGAAAFESLVMPHLPDLRKFCFSLTRSKWDAEDLCQEALLKAFVYVRNTAGNQVTKSFLFSAAKLSWIDGYRKKKDVAVPMEDETGRSDINYTAVRGMLEWVAERTSDRNMEIWMLSEYYGYTLQEIAERTDTTVSAVKSSLHRTKISLRTQRANKEMVPVHNCRQRAERWTSKVLYKECYEMTS